MLSKDYGFDTGVPELPVLGAGVSLIWQGRAKEAIDILRFMTEAYPNSPDAFEALGVAYEEDQQLERAKEAYESAIRNAKKNADRRLPMYEEYLVNIKMRMEGGESE